MTWCRRADRDPQRRGAAPGGHPRLEALNDVDGGVEVDVKVTLWPTIELPNYRDRDVEVTSPVVTPEELDLQVERCSSSSPPWRRQTGLPRRGRLRLGRRQGDQGWRSGRGGNCRRSPIRGRLGFVRRGNRRASPKGAEPGTSSTSTRRCPSASATEPVGSRLRGDRSTR